MKRKNNMTLEEAKLRSDYRFFTDEIEDYIEEIRENHLEGFNKHDSGASGIAVMELGPVDIEVNLHSAAQVIEDAAETDKTPILSYFNCTVYKRTTDASYWKSDDYLDAEVKVDWFSDDWRDILEQDMLKKLCQYVDEKGFSFDAKTAVNNK